MRSRRKMPADEIPTVADTRHRYHYLHLRPCASTQRTAVVTSLWLICHKQRHSLNGHGMPGEKAQSEIKDEGCVAIAARSLPPSQLSCWSPAPISRHCHLVLKPRLWQSGLVRDLDLGWLCHRLDVWSNLLALLDLVLWRVAHILTASCRVNGLLHLLELLLQHRLPAFELLRDHVLLRLRGRLLASPRLLQVIFDNSKSGEEIAFGQRLCSWLFSS
mmetsp:Transcript_80753/g.140178  ORF Transcript_80753/g.140178 Transcript_80753/m.140178 type:complete len:217 (-) Transcript_80753:123-773(-)